MPTKRPTTIAASDMPRVFSDDRVGAMAAELGIPDDKLLLFAKEIRRAALIFFDDVSKATGNEVHHEVDELVRAALRAVKARKRPDADCENVAILVERLSGQARKLMNKRGTLPDAEALRDPARQRDACETVARLGRLGALREPGRKRPGGKQSTTEVSVLYAPTLQQHPLRREPQHAFVMLVETAYYEATGKLPTLTASRTGSGPGPFARFVQACLDELRAGASAVDLINELHRRRRSKRLGSLLLRWDKVVDEMIARLSTSKT
jgi:hypothetical protein